MKSWIQDVRASAALDRVASTSPNRGPADSSPAQMRMELLDRVLRGGPPSLEPPACLHASIMSAVRTSKRTDSPGLAVPWKAIGVLAALVMLSGFLAAHLLRPHSRGASFPVARALNEQITVLPSTVLSPLSREWESLHQDLNETAKFLLASVPSTYPTPE